MEAGKTKCPRPGKECNEFMCGNSVDGICTIQEYKNDIKIFIDSSEFQQKVLDYIGSNEFDKTVDSTIFNDKPEYRQAIAHGMVIAAMLTSRCKQIEIYEVTDMKKCIILEIENKTDFENEMNEYLSNGYKIEASSCNSKYYKAIMVLEKE